MLIIGVGVNSRPLTEDVVRLGTDPLCSDGYNNPNRKRDVIILMLILKAECLRGSVQLLYRLMKEPGIRFEANVW